eukprot:scaffold753_cov82-Isochrysis_galbana.AAC.2
MYGNAALTSLSVPVLAAVGGHFRVRHTQPPLLQALAALPCVRSAVRSAPAHARLCAHPQCL